MCVYINVHMYVRVHINPHTDWNGLQAVAWLVPTIALMERPRIWYRSIHKAGYLSWTPEEVGSNASGGTPEQLDDLVRQSKGKLAEGMIQI